MIYKTAFLIFSLAFLAVHFASVLAGSYPRRLGHHRLVDGERAKPPKEDTILYTDRPMANSKPRRSIKNVLCYPPQGSTDNVKITRYEVQDQDQGSSGGVAFLVSGDVGMNQVCFLLKSKKDYGYRFNVNVFGFRFAPNRYQLGGFALPKEEENSEDSDDDEEEKTKDKKKVKEEEKKKEEPKKESTPSKQTSISVSVNLNHH